MVVQITSLCRSIGQYSNGERRNSYISWTHHRLIYIQSVQTLQNKLGSLKNPFAERKKGKKNCRPDIHCPN